MTKLVGILNYNPNSFSDGGKYFALDGAIARVNQLFEEGADIVDIGAESTSYGAKLISPEEEWERIGELLRLLPRKNISLDTYHYDTMAKAIDLGVGMINDVSGGKNDRVLELIAANPQVKYVLMHSLVLPANKQVRIKEYKEILDWAEKNIARCLEFGIKKEQIVFDPGIGFTTTPEQSFEVIQNIEELRKFGVETYIGHSRKTCFDFVTDIPFEERDLETITASTYMFGKVDYIRVHNVAWHRRAFNVWEKLAA